MRGSSFQCLVGDLKEEFALRARTSFRAAAWRWLLRQVCASIPSLLWIALTRTTWFSTLGAALLAYIAVGVVELLVGRAFADAAAAYRPLAMLLTFPAVVLIAYGAALFRRAAPLVLAAAMLLAVTVMTLTSAENVPGWYRVAYFIAGPAAAFLGSALHHRQAKLLARAASPRR
jgi:hypothetical protein